MKTTTALTTALLLLALPLHAANKGVPLDEEAQAFKVELLTVVKEIEGGSDAGFMKALDKVGSVRDAADGIAPTEAAFMTAASEGVAEVGREFVRKTNRCGRSKIVRVKRDGESVFALVRFDYGDAGWGWVDMELAPGLDGGMRIVDVINYSTGQNLVESIRNYAAQALEAEESKASLFGFKSGSDETAHISDLLADLKGGEYADGVQDFYDMEGGLRARKDIAFLGLRSAALAGNPISFMKILKGLSEDRGADPGLTLLLADYYFVIDDHARALARIEAFERAAEVRDAALLAGKAQAACQMQRPDLGIAYAREAVEAEPGLSDGHWAALLCHAVTYRYDLATAEAKILEDKFDYRMDEEMLSKSEIYSGLLGSRDYRKWRESLEEE